MQPDLHLVVPAYNESRRLPRFLRSLCEALSHSGLSCSLRVVNDGSTAEESKALDTLVESLRATHPFLQPVHHLTPNQGKGAAIREGWILERPTRYQGFVDADGAISPDEVVRMASAALASKVGALSFFASRIRMLGRQIERNEMRHYAGRVFASMVGFWIDSRIYDSQCGYKLIHVEAWDKIAGSLQETGYAFDVELLAYLRQKNQAVVEFPIDWSDQSGSKVHLIRDAIRMIQGLRRIRKRLALNH